MMKSQLISCLSWLFLLDLIQVNVPIGKPDTFNDSEGNVPLWEAIANGHEDVAKLLKDNGATLSSGDMAQFSCFAAEQNNLDLLKSILRHGGDITLPKNNGSTALHLAVCEGNIEMVKFLLQKGANVDLQDGHGWTPRNLAEQQGHEDITVIFQTHKEEKGEMVISIPENKKETRFLGRFTSEPMIHPINADVSFSTKSGSRRRANNFHNSLFGIMSAANDGNNSDLVSSINSGIINVEMRNEYPTRVIISCEKYDKGKLVLLPKSFEELLEVGVKKLGFLASKVVTKDGAEIDEIELIRDGDHLVFVNDG